MTMVAPMATRSMPMSTSQRFARKKSKMRVTALFLFDAALQQVGFEHEGAGDGDAFAGLETLGDFHLTIDRRFSLNGVGRKVCAVFGYEYDLHPVNFLNGVFGNEDRLRIGDRRGCLLVDGRSHEHLRLEGLFGIREQGPD